MKLMDYPIQANSFVEAVRIAVNESLTHRDFFLYVKHCTSGYYVIDYLGIVFDNEKVLSTFRNGEQTL